MYVVVQRRNRGREEVTRGYRVHNDVEHEIEERRIIEAAMARGYTATRWMAFALALLFIASGLWWAGLLVVVLTSFEIPRFVTQR